MMKLKKPVFLLLCLGTAALLAALALLTRQFPDLFSSVMAFPFQQIGWALELLSASGSVGNGAAAALWLGLSLIPALFALRYQKGKETLWERAALYGLSAVLFFALYGMVNPSLFAPSVPLSPASQGLPDFSKLIRACLGGAVWAAAILFVTLRLLRLFRQGNKEQLLGYLENVLTVLCLFFSGAAAVTAVNGAAELVSSVQTGADVIFGAFRLLAELVPYGFDLLVFLRAARLLKIAGSEEQEDLLPSAEGVSRLCCLALGVTTALTAVSDLVQLLFARGLSRVAVNVDLPVLSLALTGMILLFSRLLTENKKLRDDNSLFI